jgi:hypothetical protein
VRQHELQQRAGLTRELLDTIRLHPEDRSWKQVQQRNEKNRDARNRSPADDDFGALFLSLGVVRSPHAAATAAAALSVTQTAALRYLLIRYDDTVRLAKLTTHHMRTIRFLGNVKKTPETTTVLPSLGTETVFDRIDDVLQNATSKALELADLMASAVVLPREIIQALTLLLLQRCEDHLEGDTASRGENFAARSRQREILSRLAGGSTSGPELMPGPGPVAPSRNTRPAWPVR